MCNNKPHIVATINWCHVGSETWLHLWCTGVCSTLRPELFQSSVFLHDGMWSHHITSGNHQSCNTQPCSKCSITCGCPHPLLSPGTQWWTGWLWELCKVTSCLLLSYMYLHFTVLYAFVLLQQKANRLVASGNSGTCPSYALMYTMVMGQQDASFYCLGTQMLKCVWHNWMKSHSYINFPVLEVLYLCTAPALASKLRIYLDSFLFIYFLVCIVRHLMKIIPIFSFVSVFFFSWVVVSL